MPICSYLVMVDDDATPDVARRLAALPGCEVTPARETDVLILVTDTPDLAEEEALRRRVEEIDGIQALLFTFGEIDPDTEVGDPVAIGRTRPGGAP